MKRERIRYGFSEGSFAAKLCAVLALIAAAVRILGNWGFWAYGDQKRIFLQVLLPVLACLLFALSLLYLGKKLFTMSFIPIILGAVFITADSLGGSVLNTALCALVGAALSAVYTATLFGAFKSKLPAAAAFILPLAYRILITDKDMFLIKDRVDLNEWLPELSVLLMLLSVLLAILCMKKRVSEVNKALTDKDIEKILLENEEKTEETGNGEEYGQAD